MYHPCLVTDKTQQRSLTATHRGSQAAQKLVQQTAPHPTEYPARPGPMSVFTPAGSLSLKVFCSFLQLCTPLGKMGNSAVSGCHLELFPVKLIAFVALFNFVQKASKL